MTKVKIKFIVIMLLTCSIAATSQDIQFVDMQNLPEARSALTSANDGENIYIVNGFGTTETYTSTVFKYNVPQNSWSTLTSSILPKRFASAAIVGDHLYIFNGIMENNVINSSVEKINTTNGTIQLLSDNPLPSRIAGVATWNDKIYSFGGTIAPYQVPYQYSNKLFEFDPANDTWTELTEIPFTGETKGEIIDGKLYVIGGYNGTVSKRIDVYNISTNVWEANYEMPIGISAHATTVIDKKIFLVGDYGNLTSLASFDTSDNSFQILTSNLNARRHCAAEGIENSLFAIGGNTESSIPSSISSVQMADITTSIQEVSNVELIKVFPNPTSNMLNLNMEFDELYIYDTHGKEIRSFQNVMEVDISKLNNGIYFIKGISQQKIFQSKFLKK